MAKPVGTRLFFAGEACYEDDPATVTGAYQSGLLAAQHIAALLQEKLRPFRPKQAAYNMH